MVTLQPRRAECGGGGGGGWGSSSATAALRRGFGCLHPGRRGGRGGLFGDVRVSGGECGAGGGGGERDSSQPVEEIPFDK